MLFEVTFKDGTGSTYDCLNPYSNGICSLSNNAVINNQNTGMS